MTTEDDFQRKLDTSREDWQTRLVFADWLEDRGDPRGPGYRALGNLRLWPYSANTRNWWTAEGDGHPYYNHLPHDWFEQVAGYAHRSEGRWRWPEAWDESNDNRRAIEDAAALAFAKLPIERRTELLTPRPPKPVKAPAKPQKKRQPKNKK